MKTQPANLLELLNTRDAAARHKAVFDLIHVHHTGDIPEFWSLLDNDSDDDVVLLLASHLSQLRRGTADQAAYARIQSAIRRFDGNRATAEVLEDVFLHIFKNMSKRDIVLAPRSEKNRLLADRTQLDL